MTQRFKMEVEYPNTLYMGRKHDDYFIEIAGEKVGVLESFAISPPDGATPAHVRHWIIKACGEWFYSNPQADKIMVYSQTSRYNEMLILIDKAQTLEFTVKKQD